MKDSEFASIFLGPLYHKKIDIKNINKNIYKEVLDLANRFLISSQVGQPYEDILLTNSMSDIDPESILEVLLK